MGGGRVWREDLRKSGRGDGRHQAGTGELVVVVATQVPRHRLEPGQGVCWRPWLHPIVREALSEDRVLHAHVVRAAGLGDVGVDPVGISLEVLSYTHLRAHETVLDLVCRLL